MIQPLSRRAWIERLFGGIGAAGIAGLLPAIASRPRRLGRYAGPRMPGKARHVISLVHGRRAIAVGYVRSQACAAEV